MSIKVRVNFDAVRFSNDLSNSFSKNVKVKTNQVRDLRKILF